MNKEREEDIIGWCVYCKDAIYADMPYIVSKGKMYHHSKKSDDFNCFELAKEVGYDDDEIVRVDDSIEVDD